MGSFYPPLLLFLPLINPYHIRMENCFEVDSIIKSFGDRTILADIYFSLCKGDVVGLFGRNGTGKSTLLKIIFGTMKGERSFIRIDGKVQKQAAFRSGKIAYLPQHNFLPSALTIPAILDMYIPKEQHKEFLADPFLFKNRKAKIKELSGGEQRYLEIKLILYYPVPYIFLDEPFNALAPVAAKAIREHITLCSRDKGIFLTDHNFREVHKVVNRILLLHDCYLKEVKEPEELIPYGYYRKE